MTLSRLVGRMSCFTQLAAYTTEFRDATPSWSTYPPGSPARGKWRPRRRPAAPRRPVDSSRRCHLRRARSTRGSCEPDDREAPFDDGEQCFSGAVDWQSRLVGIEPDGERVETAVVVRGCRARRLPCVARRPRVADGAARVCVPWRRPPPSPTHAGLWSSRVSVWIWPMSRASSRRRPVGSNGLAVRPVVIG
jgi:hypothetical protein